MDSEHVPKVTKCEVCNTKPTKYTCPKCAVRTCCVTCVKLHKKNANCTGVAEKTKFKPVKEITEKDLYNDFQLLDKTHFHLTRCISDTRKKWTTINGNLPPKLFCLRKAAGKRGIKLHFMPKHFQRHLKNTSFFKLKTDNLYWKIEWIFPDSLNNVEFIDEQISDSEMLCDLMEKYVSPRNNVKGMEPYYAAGYENILALLKKEKTVNTFVALDPLKSLQENLSGQLIIEHPTVYIILLNNLASYNIEFVPENAFKYAPKSNVNLNSTTDIRLEDTPESTSTIQLETTSVESTQMVVDSKLSSSTLEPVKLNAPSNDPGSTSIPTAVSGPISSIGAEQNTVPLDSAGNGKSDISFRKNKRFRRKKKNKNGNDVQNNFKKNFNKHQNNSKRRVYDFVGINL